MENSLDEFAFQIIEANTYSALRSRLKNSNCRRCELWKGRTNIVVDRGRPASRVMLIGEAPGAEEDIQGEAFVGRAGKLLDKLFLEIGLTNGHDTLIANVVKCRPQANRTPTREEAQTCLPYLMRQIELVNPELILLLGATAAKHLVNEKARSPMASIVGKLFDMPRRHGTKAMILYHPAYLLRDPRKRTPTRSHLRKVRQFLLDRGLM